MDMSAVPLMPEFPSSILSGFQAGQTELKVGMDLVRIERIQTSLARFGERFQRRIYTREEWAYAQASPHLMLERLAARFAAKEAAFKALGLPGLGASWQDMEVVRQDDGAVALRLSGRAQVVAAQNGVLQTALSISHDGAYAAAIVAVIARIQHV